jgi:hypothetical protein
VIGEYHLARPANVNTFTPVQTRFAPVRSRIRKNPYQFSKIDGDIEKSSDFISEIVRPRPSDYCSARGREPTPPVPGIQHDRSLTEDF